jgi:hypothetical protein
MARKQKDSLYKYSALIAGLLIVFLAIAVYFNRQAGLPTNGIIPTLSPTATPTESEFQIDLEDDGVYTNYKYGYRFEYPEDVFGTASHTPDGDYVIWNLELDSTSERSVPRVFFTAKAETNFNEPYEQLASTNLTEISTVRNLYQKLSTSSTRDYKMVEVFTQSQPDYEVEPIVAFEAAWLTKTRPLIVISFFASPEDVNILDSNKEIFDQLVNSFEFFR